MGEAAKPLELEREPYCLRVERHFPDPVKEIVLIKQNRVRRAIAVDPSKAASLSTSLPGEKSRDHILEDASLSFLHLCDALKVTGHSRTIEAIKKLSILDLGCGSDSYRTFAGITYPPDLCRDLHRIGANATGVDIRLPNKTYTDEGWDFHQLDLMQKGVLEILNDNSFDFVNMDMITGHDNYASLSPDIPFKNTSCPGYKEFEAELFQQALRVLKPGGLLAIDGFLCIYRKVLSDDFIFRFQKVSDKGENNMPYEHVSPECLTFEQ